MRSLLALFLLLVALVEFTSAIIDYGNCPEWTNIESFEVIPYIGRWYEAQRFESGFQLDMTCVTADYEPLSETSLSVTNTANFPNGTVTSITGNATATQTPGQLIVYFPGKTEGVYNVLDTDYSTYSCIYICAQVGNIREQFAWILSRYQELDADTLAAARAVFEGFNIDVSYFQDTRQGGNCTYTPPPNDAL